MKLSRKMSKFTMGISAVLPVVAMLAVGANAIMAGPAQAQKGKGGGDPIVEFDTDKGSIKAVIYQKDAPITSDNFLDLVNKHFYDGKIFHRYEPGFCLQGGDPNGNGSGNYVDPSTGHTRHIKLEKIAKITHDSAGVLAMARTQDPDSASCQFYFTLGPAPFLDNPPGYAAFGKIVEGMDTLMALRKGDKMNKVFVVKAGGK